jgi:cell division cycle 20-like protein 1 (cofactor of APC complex)
VTEAHTFTSREKKKQPRAPTSNSTYSPTRRKPPIAMAELQIDSAASREQQTGDDLRTPTLLSPPESKTPPTEMHKRHRDPDAPSMHNAASEAIDADLLTRALEEFDGRQRGREQTPEASPRRKRQRVIGDR